MLMSRAKVAPALPTLRADERIGRYSRGATFFAMGVGFFFVGIDVVWVRGLLTP